MTPMARLWFAVAACAVTCAGPVSAQTRAELSGRWRLEGPVTPTLESVVPAWEAIVTDGSTVAITRATRANATETYLADEIEREVPRVAGQPRACRTTWEQQRLVIACTQPGGGPGGGAPPITTRDVRYLDAEGRLVVERTWRSGDRVTTDRRLFRRDVRP